MERVVAGRFALIDRIGAGGSGSVWRAYDHRARRYCAAKLVRPHDITALLRAVREQAFRLSHPHLLTPYSWAAEDDEVLLAMELSRGGSLATLIDDYGRLPPAYAATILDQLLAALSHVHAAGVVHRDVKPANLLLEPSGTGAPHARLADFGIAVGEDGMRFTSTGYVVGTRGYVAPEVLAGRESGHRQDLYAAGMVARRMLLGSVPLDTDPAIAAGDVPPTLWSVVDRLSAWEPDHRPADAPAARQMLAACGLVLRLPAQTADGETIEIFDHTGPLPPGWAPDGPEGSVGPVSPATAPAPSPAPPSSPPPASEPATVPVQVRPGPVSPAPPPQPVRPAGRRSRRRAFAVMGGAAAGIILAVSGVWFAYGQNLPGDPDNGGTNPSSSVRTSSPVPGVDPGRAPLPGISVGGECPWQDVGQVEKLTDGRSVRCEFQSDGSHRWELVS